MCGVIKPLVKRVVVSHPKSLARIARDPRKYDKRDARKLADLLRGGLTHEVFLPETLPRRANCSRPPPNYTDTRSGSRWISTCFHAGKSQASPIFDPLRLGPITTGRRTKRRKLQKPSLFMKFKLFFFHSSVEI
ncbi:MAG: hypothetical protein KIS76_06590 [Pyrinomonadaceae bacterium]|nr:hypothetical protein [Pyrinomonadaceae bacterium]